MRPALEYASSIWLPLASSTSINKLQFMQNAVLRTATGCTQDTNTHHLHDEILTLPIHKHLQLHASQYKQETQHPSHPLHSHTTYFNYPRLKPTIFNNDRYTPNIPTDPHTVNNKKMRTLPPRISSSEDIFPASLVAPLLHSEQINQNTSITTMPPLQPPLTRQTPSLQLQPHTHHVVTTVFVGRPC